MCVGICSWLFEHQAIQTHFILGASQTKVLLSLRPGAVPLRQERVGHMHFQQPRGKSAMLRSAF